LSPCLNSKNKLLKASQQANWKVQADFRRRREWPMRSGQAQANLSPAGGNKKPGVGPVFCWGGRLPQAACA
jgi:hypothetical protein